jgi:hypothetical protein
MSQDDGSNGGNSGADTFGDLVSRNFGALLTISLHQTRALMELTNAIRIDPNVSENTRAEAEKASMSVDKMIVEFDKMANAVGSKSGFEHD